jgi:hypothetical protein
MQKALTGCVDISKSRSVDKDAAKKWDESSARAKMQTRKIARDDEASIRSTSEADSERPKRRETD